VWPVLMWASFFFFFYLGALRCQHQSRNLSGGSSSPVEVVGTWPMNTEVDVQSEN
jgi:hypothetical protein